MTPAEVSRMLRSAYPHSGRITDTLIKWRPFICPFHRVAEFVPADAAVLEVGCGIGLMTVLLAQTGRIKRALGVDVSASAIAVAQKARLPGEVEVAFACLAEHEDWPQGFDTVLCVDVLHHLPRKEQRSFVKRLAAVEPGRTIIIKDISPRPRWKALANLFHDLLVSRQRAFLRDEASVREWLEKEGLEIGASLRLDVWWYSHYLLVAQKPLR